MDKYINFEFEYFQDELLNLHSDISFPNVLQEEHLVKNISSGMKIDTTEMVHKKLNGALGFEKDCKGFELVPELKDPYIMHYEIPSETNTSFINSKNIKKEEVWGSKDTTTESVDKKEWGFQNPVNYKKHERFSKKYDKGTLFYSNWISLKFLSELNFLQN